LREFACQAVALDEQKCPLSESAGKQRPVSTEWEWGRGEGLTSELTARQYEILEMVAAGSSYKEVGAVLHISENTVKYHMGEILQRLHVKNREQVVAYALRTGLVHQR
jgi:DNA-binding CsgD family transcriptional regulator